MLYACDIVNGGLQEVGLNPVADSAAGAAPNATGYTTSNAMGNTSGDATGDTTCDAVGRATRSNRIAMVLQPMRERRRPFVIRTRRERDGDEP